MKLYNSLAVLLALAIPVFAGERDAVVTDGGCTQFVCNDEFLITAKHCGVRQTLTVPIAGKKVTARLVYEPKTEDGPLVYRLPKGKYDSLYLSPYRPLKGHAVYSLGYPNGNWCRAEGTVINVGESYTWSSHQINPGNSGGPLLNDQGQVIGVALVGAEKWQQQYSGFARYDSMVTALTSATTPEIIVFTYPGCGPCKRLKADVRRGAFEGYDFAFISYANGQWTDENGKDASAIYQEFHKTTSPGKTYFPTIWVRETKNYKTGYGHSGGLLGWLKDAVKTLVRKFIGEQDAPMPTPPKPTPAPDITPGMPPQAPSPADDSPSPLWGLLGLATGFLHRRYA